MQQGMDLAKILPSQITFGMSQLRYILLQNYYLFYLSEKYQMQMECNLERHLVASN